VSWDGLDAGSVPATTQLESFWRAGSPDADKGEEFSFNSAGPGSVTPSNSSVQGAAGAAPGFGNAVAQPRRISRLNEAGTSGDIMVTLDEAMRGSVRAVQVIMASRWRYGSTGERAACV
jgi:hypothetical protein